MMNEPMREPMASGDGRDAVLQRQLMTRRDQLRRHLPGLADPEPLRRLLVEVDEALERIDAGTYGFCETCRDAIENECLAANPLCRNCLDHLSSAERSALERDLDLAFQVQSGLLPQAGPVATGWTMAFHYQPAGPVSGDYLDLIRLEDGRALFLLGDVMGKGVAASMLTAHLHAIFRSLSHAEQPVQELVAKANRVFCEGTMSAFFATLVCGRLGGKGDIEVCNAGHCRPLLVADGKVAQIEPNGLPLGIFPDAQYACYHGRLAEGDSLLVHSDGLSETFDGDGREYGNERLFQVLRRQGALPPQQRLSAVLADLAHFRGCAALADDLSLMVIDRIC